MRLRGKCARVRLGTDSNAGTFVSTFRTESKGVNKRMALAHRSKILVNLLVRQNTTKMPRCFTHSGSPKAPKIGKSNKVRSSRPV